MIEVAVRQHDRGDRRLADGARMQGWERVDLLADVGRGVQENPALVIGGDCDALLRTGARWNRSRADTPAVRASAIPLREPAAGGGAEDANAHGAPRRLAGLALVAAGGQLRVHLDFGEARGLPDHRLSRTASCAIPALLHSRLSRTGLTPIGDRTAGLTGRSRRTIPEA